MLIARDNNSTCNNYIYVIAHARARNRAHARAFFRSGAASQFRDFVSISIFELLRRQFKIIYCY